MGKSKKNNFKKKNNKKKKYTKNNIYKKLQIGGNKEIKIKYIIKKNNEDDIEAYKTYTINDNSEELLVNVIKKEINNLLFENRINIPGKKIQIEYASKNPNSLINTEIREFYENENFKGKKLNQINDLFLSKDDNINEFEFTIYIGEKQASGAVTSINLEEQGHDVGKHFDAMTRSERRMSGDNEGAGQAPASEDGIENTEEKPTSSSKKLVTGENLATFISLTGIAGCILLFFA